MVRCIILQLIERGVVERILFHFDQYDCSNIRAALDPHRGVFTKIFIAFSKADLHCSSGQDIPPLVLIFEQCIRLFSTFMVTFKKHLHFLRASKKKCLGNFVREVRYDLIVGDSKGIPKCFVDCRRHPDDNGSRSVWIE